MKILRDSFGRSFPYIRLSITDVCNFKCGYCLPNGYQIDKSDNRTFLKKEEIGRLAKALSELGVCKKYNVEMGAAALQFSMKDKRITSTICGVTSVQSIEKNLAWAKTDIPEEFWNEVLKLPYSTKDPESERTYTPG